jgi:3'-phosphoadenosine 5'-phosphosulfate (PAPS) 3'-phosphatase
MAHRRYTWIIAPLVGLEAFRNPADSNYHIEVLLLKNDVPLASFAYFPEYEGDGAEGVLFEASHHLHQMPHPAVGIAPLR